MSKKYQALTSRTLFVKAGEHNIAYRTMGSGRTIVLCNRFRGTLDTWDPEFLEQLAKKMQVIIFDYPGIGRSTGQLAPSILGVATDVKAFTTALNLERFVLLGWSYGGTAAQTFAAQFPEEISHLVLIGTNPPGDNAVPPEQVFFDAALKPVNDFEDELVLFFEPLSASSVKAARLSHERISARKEDFSINVPPERFGDYFLGAADFKEDPCLTRIKLAATNVPILCLMGDHDPSFPVENWFPLIRVWKTLQFIILPNSGHAPQHEFPKLSARYIHNFIKQISSAH